VVNAQFGGVLDRARRKVEDAQSKAKPVTDRAEKAVETYAAWTPEQEQEIGAATAAKMVAVFGVVDSPKLVKYVNLVGSAVARNAPRQVPYRFGVLDSDIVGAFALPGGYIFITRAAIESMDNEAQLAGALGHEIIHVSERHLESEIRGKKTSSWAIQEAKAKAGTNTPEFLRARAEALVQDLLSTKLSRDKEDGADERGTLLAAQSGYHPAGLLEFLRTLDKAQSSATGQRATGQLLSTHPPFPDRIASLGPVIAKAGNKGQTLAPRFQAALK
jgi:predicted Zn-dependent protease